MANNVGININLESAEALAALKKLGNAFTSTEWAVEGTTEAMEDLGKATKQVGKTAPDAAKGMVASFNKAERSVKEAGEASKELHDQLSQTAKAFFGLELGKMVAGYADEVLSAAAANDKLTGKAKDTALAYAHLKENISDIQSGMVLALANLAGSIGGVLNLNGLLEDTASAWREIAGLKQQVTEDNDAANAYNLELANLAALAKGYQTSAKEYERYKSSNKEFADVAKASMQDYARDIDASNAKLETLGKKLDEATLAALKAGKVTTTQIRSGEWERRYQKQTAWEERLKQAAEKELAEFKQLQAQKLAAVQQYTAQVLALTGSEYDKRTAQYATDLEHLEESYNSGLLALNKYTEAKRVIQEQYYDWVDAYEANRQDPSGQAAADAYTAAKAKADAENQAKTASGAESMHDALAAAQHHNQQIKEWDDQLTQQRLDNLQTYLGGYQSLLATLGASNKKAAIAAKAVSFIQAVINAREAASKAWAQGGILGAFGAGAALAGGMAQAYEIKSQKFAGGGIVHGQRLTGDTVPIAANPGEMVLTQAQQASLYKLSQGSQQVAQMPPISIHVAAGVDALAVKKALSESMPDLQRQLAKAMGSSNFKTAQRAI